MIGTGIGKGIQSAQAIPLPPPIDHDLNPTTGNPHPTATDGDPGPGTTERGNPHNAAGCTGNPHGEVAAGPAEHTDPCKGSQ